MSRAIRLGAIISALIAAAACASVPAAPRGGPRFPDYPPLEVPAALGAGRATVDRLAAAGARLQAGDVRGAGREYGAILSGWPEFYPAETGLGFVALAGGDFASAGARFQAALGRDDRYVPAWRGLVEAELGAGNDEAALAALERLLALDDSREGDRARLELLKLRRIESLVGSGTAARDAGRLDDADRLLRQALGLAPASVVVLRELARVELARGDTDGALAHARRAVEADASDASAHAIAAEVLEARGELRDAATELARAAALDPDYAERAAAARTKADESLGPTETRDVARLATVTRGQLAALIGTRLESLVARAPKRIPDVATDVQGHWASTWILAVTQAGIMNVFANHTFQPTAAVRRTELADAMATLVVQALAGRPEQLRAWQDARPAFADVPTTNLYYRAAALAVASGAMSADAGRFQPTRAATGAEILAAIARIERLTGR